METPFDQAACAVFALTDRLEDFAHEGERSLIKRALIALDAFSKALSASDQPPATHPPARYAMALHIDQQVRQLRNVRLSTWGVLAHQQLFDGRDISPARIAEFERTAAQSGTDYAPLADFLRKLRDREERGTVVERTRSNWGRSALLCATLFFLGLASYAGWLEYRFHAKITEAFRQDELRIGLDRNPTGGDLAARLTQLAEAKDRVGRAAQFAPFRRLIRLPILDSETIAVDSYGAAIATHVPPALTQALEITLATEGDGLKLYDALRAWGILAGTTAWQPGYLAGWMADAQTQLGWPGFATHVAAMTAPAVGLIPSDNESFAQARTFAAETSEIDRVWLELKRGQGTRALAPWQATDAVSGVADVLMRRSGTPLEDPIEGIFTQDGWDYARDFGIGIAVRDARELAPLVLGAAVQSANDTPDLVQDRLHSETIVTWKDWLSDLRVQPFTDRDRAILVSGALSQRSNPLTRLLQEVWQQSGGNDRRRSHAQQISLGTAFGPMIQYVERDGMAQLAQIFSALNVALGSIDLDAARGAERLMSVQDRAQSINALQNAPPILVQIAEDVLAQASSAREDDGGNDLVAAWQRNVYPLCRAALEGQFPFANGPDAAAANVAALLGPEGALNRFAQGFAAPYLDQSTTPWRWKPEARFAGLDPESAAFFERAAAVSNALFDDTGQLRAVMTLTALAERGTTVMALGGQGVPVRATGAPAELVWPGPDPAQGVQVSFREATQGAQINQPGLWGLQRMLDGLRLRLRDDGARVLVDLRTNEGRIFVEVSLARALNPISGRAAMRDFACPPRL